MLSPVVIPFPLALVLVVLLAVAVYAANRLLSADVVNPWAGQSWAFNAPADKPTGGRHRPENIAEPIDWATLTARRMLADHRARVTVEPRTQLAAIEAAPLPIAGLPDREPIEPGHLHVTGDLAIVEPTSELATV